MGRRHAIGLAVCAVEICACADGPTSDSTACMPLLTLQRCHLSAPDHPARVEARCGFVEVPESWAAKSGRKIRLHVAVVAADTDQPQPDPLVYLAGGPGQAATESYPPMESGFDRVRRKRDILLVDQRGTGKSHPLRCDPPEDQYLIASEEQEEERLRGCLASLQGSADLPQYTTGASIRDLDFVRQQLGYARLNLYGVSYGTRMALSYLRRYPQQVRSVVLDGVVPQQQVLGPAILAEGPARTREQTLRRCAAEPSCKQRFPRLAQELDAVEQRLRTDPPQARVIHPRTGRPVEAELGWQRWSLTLRLRGYSAESLSLLPLLVHTAHQSQDYAPLIVQSLYVGDLLRSSVTVLENSVLCAEDWPYYRPPTSAPASAPSRPRYGEREIRSLRMICSIWPHRPVGRDFKRPVSSAAPTLILSGEIDPVTPPANGELVARTLSRSRHLVVPGQGHGVVTRGCLPRIVADFIDSGRPERLDTSCITRIKPVRFFIDPSGPEA